MPKYRITNTNSNDLKGATFFIERKGLFGWKRIRIRENGDTKRLTFNSYVEAEHYLITNYCKFSGQIYQPRPNEYHYETYNHYV
jgi:hypothetical protein